jgi:hypothetical protein
MCATSDKICEVFQENTNIIRGIYIAGLFATSVMHYHYCIINAKYYDVPTIYFEVFFTQQNILQ